MKTLTVVEIVKYAIRIEEESLRFYRSAGKFLVDEDASYDRLYGMSTMDETVRDRRFLASQKPGAGACSARPETDKRFRAGMILCRKDDFHE